MPDEESRVAINSDQDIVLARQKGRTLAADSGFSSVDATLIATAISELARNIVTYAKRGEILRSRPRHSGHSPGTPRWILDLWQFWPRTSGCSSFDG